MKQLNYIGRAITIILIIFVFLSNESTGQENKTLIIYDNPEQMVTAAKEVITEIPVDEFKDIYTRDGIYVIDVRSAEEYNEGAIPGAVNIPRGVLEFRIGQDKTWESVVNTPPKKNDTILVYCGTGSRGALSAKTLMQLGYTNVKSLKGGWGAWQQLHE